MKVGILLPNWIGDVVMATPTLRAIRSHFGQETEIAYVVRPAMSEVLAGTTWCDREFHYDRRSSSAELRGWNLLSQLRDWRPDTFVLLTNSLWAGVLACLAGASTRVGYSRNGRGPLLTTRLEPLRDGGKLRPISAIDYYLELAYALGCARESPRLELATLPRDEEIVDRIWRRGRLDQASRVVVFNTGSAVGSAKHWPVENYIELARRVVGDRGNAVLIICGPAERETARRIAAAVHHPRVYSMADEDLSIGVSKACVRRADIMVTTDSGPRHYAPAFNIPVITLFGPIDYRWSDSHHPWARNLSHPVDCGPCGKMVCPFEHHRCMRGLTVDQVHAELSRCMTLRDRQGRSRAG